MSDPKKMPVLDPKPTIKIKKQDNNGEAEEEIVCSKQYLHGILQGIAEVEREGYRALQDLGATPVKEVLTAGGGAKNDMWMMMRQRLLGVSTRRADNVDAAFGCARLAAKFFEQ